MKRKSLLFSALILILASTISVNATAQTKDISLTAGVYTPLYQGVSGGLSMNLNYGQFNESGLGFRTGLQWVKRISQTDNAFGIPVAIAWRSPSRSGLDRAQSRTGGSYRGYGYASLPDAAGSLLAGFIMNLFSDVEFFAGATPGWVAGSSSFSLTLDAGMCINYSIWRFDIKLMPAFHYDPLGSVKSYSRTNPAGTPLNWYFSFSGGLAFRF